MASSSRSDAATGGPQPGDESERDEDAIPVDGQPAKLKGNRMHAAGTLRLAPQSDKAIAGEFGSTRRGRRHCGGSTGRNETRRQWRFGRKFADEVAPALALVGGHALPALGVAEELVALDRIHRGEFLERFQ